MLAASAGRRLALVDPPTFKSSSAPPSPSKQTALDVEFTALAWGYDNSGLFVASEGSIRRYDSTGHFERILHSTSGRVSAMAVKDNKTVIYANEDKAHALDCASGAVLETYDGHTSPIKSISLSKDWKHLATSSPSECIVHNLTDKTKNSLSGLPSSSNAELGVCTFHPHSQTRLLVSYGRSILIYDVSSHAEPAKVISLVSSATRNMGDVVAISCSPFSKSLAAVASSSGIVCLIDFEKEKGLFKTMDMKAPLTSLAFSQDGSALLAGTETGQLLMQDLRALDKPPKKMTISTEGKRIVGLAVQRKIRSSVTQSSSPSSATSRTKIVSKPSPRSSKPLSTLDLNVKPVPGSRRVSNTSSKPAVSPSVSVRLARTVSGVNRPFGTPSRRVSGAKDTATPKPGKLKRSAPSPLTSCMNESENAGDLSERMEALTALVTKRKAHAKTTTSSKPLSSPKSKQTVFKARSGAADRQNEDPDKKRTRKVSTAETIRSNTSVATMKGSSANSIQSKTSSTTSRTRNNINMTATGGTSSTPPVPRVPSPLAKMHVKGRDRLGIRPEARERTVSNSTSVSAALAARRKTQARNVPSNATSRTSSLDLEDIEVDLPSPTVGISAALRAEAQNLAKSKARATPRSATGTPSEMDGWPISARPVEEEKLEKKRVEFEFDLEKEQAPEESDDSDEEEVQNLELQVSPRRPQVGPVDVSASSSSLQLTPLRAMGMRPAPQHYQSNGTPNSSFAFPLAPGTPNSVQKAHEFMRKLLSSAMYDFQQETRAEMMGLHLDLLRIGRGFRTELREVLTEVWEDEVRMLTEENMRLRQENERLRMAL